MILSVFCVRLIRMVGPSATAAAAAPVVVTNSRRSIPFRLVMDLPSIQNEMRCLVSGAWCLGIRLPDTRHQTPDTRHPSDRIHHAEGVLVSRPDTRAPPGHRPEILESHGVAARPEPNQGIGIVIQLAEQSRAVLLEVLRRIRL